MPEVVHIVKEELMKKKTKLKVKLSLDDLKIESFETEAPDVTGGSTCCDARYTCPVFCSPTNPC